MDSLLKWLNEFEPTRSDYPQLDLYFIGEGVGESVILKLADQFTSVIDAFGGGTHSITASFLDYLEVKKIDFLQMSHIHSDHFSGLSFLMDKFDVCGVGHSYPSHLHAIRQLAVLAEVVGDEAGVTAKETPLTRLFSKINQHKESKWKEDLVNCYKTLTNGMQIYEKTFGNTNFSFNCLAPVTSVFDTKFLKDAEKHITKTKKNRTFMGASFFDQYTEEINNTSAISRVEYGKSLVLLAGDSERKMLSQLNYKNLSKNLDNIQSLIVKIPHHGSSTSDATFFFDKKVTNGKKLIAVVTPYNRHELPEEGVIKKYIDAGYDVYQTSKIDVASPEDDHDSDVPCGAVRVICTAEGDLKIGLFGNAHKIVI